MDAASKTGVDDVREIIDNVKYKPVNCKFKIFIIDEVHMLSKSAFNALLKTLEEPPEALTKREIASSSTFTFSNSEILLRCWIKSFDSTLLRSNL
jgi:replication-associated recombination protein RarA